MSDFLRTLTAQRVLPVLRGYDAESTLRTVDAVVDGGWRVVELTMTSPDGYRDLERVRRRHEDLVVGMGTVFGSEQVKSLAELGVDFVVTPVCAAEVVEACETRGLPVVAGALTPTEVLAAHMAGAEVVKIFPAGRLGPGYLADLGAVLPGIPLLPTGAVQVRDIGAYLENGAVAVGLGASLTRAALAGDAGALESLRTRVCELRRRWEAP